MSQARGLAIVSDCMINFFFLRTLLNTEVKSLSSQLAGLLLLICLEKSHFNVCFTLRFVMFLQYLESRPVKSHRISVRLAQFDLNLSANSFDLLYFPLIFEFFTKSHACSSWKLDSPVILRMYSLATRTMETQGWQFVFCVQTGLPIFFSTEYNRKVLCRQNILFHFIEFNK